MVFLESDENATFIPIFRAETGQKCFLAEELSRGDVSILSVMALTVVPEKLMVCTVLLQLCHAWVSWMQSLATVFFCPISLPQPPLARSDTHLFQQCLLLFLSTLHNHRIVSYLCLRRQWKKVSIFTLAIHFTSICLQKLSLFLTYLYLSQNETSCNLGIACFLSSSWFMQASFFRINKESLGGLE